MYLYHKLLGFAVYTCHIDATKKPFNNDY